MYNSTIILVAPQMGENIGATARAMSNFGLDDLRLVSPRDGWPNPKANEMAAHGEFIIEKTRVFETVNDAIADLNFLIATTANPRYMEKPITSPREVYNLAQGKVGIMFGCERSGLTNEQLVMADVITQIPTSNINPSLNIAQAVGIMCYELFTRNINVPQNKNTPLATKEELDFFLTFLESNLEKTDFFKNKKLAPTMKRNIRNIFTRQSLTSQDTRTLMGIIRSLIKSNYNTVTKS
jgi:tRNA/rRNA methyltransferase